MMRRHFKHSTFQPHSRSGSSTNCLQPFPQISLRRPKSSFAGPLGADAVEAALKLVKTATGRRSLLCFHGSYHGMTSGALSLTGDIAAKAAIPGLMPEVQFLPYPSDYRCPFRIGGEAGRQASAHYIETLLDDPSSGVPAPAAMILEVVQGEGGINPAPDEWLRKVRDITRRRGIVLVVDEVQTGLGRTGSLFAFQRAGVKPDVVVLSKAIGGGLPLAVIVYHRDLDLWKPGAHAGTFRGNQLGFAAGAATIRHVRVNRLDQHARGHGQSPDARARPDRGDGVFAWQRARPGPHDRRRNY